MGRNLPLGIDEMLGTTNLKKASENRKLSSFLPKTDPLLVQPPSRLRSQSTVDMFARKDLERDVLSAYQRHRRNLKKASADSKSDDSKQPRMVQIDAAEDAEGGEGSGSVKSPTSDVDSSYTYTNTDEPITKGRSGSSNGEVEETGEMMDHKHESAAEEAEMREHT